jgi:hypothetical protein
MMVLRRNEGQLASNCSRPTLNVAHSAESAGAPPEVTVPNIDKLNSRAQSV